MAIKLTDKGTSDAGTPWFRLGRKIGLLTTQTCFIRVLEEDFDKYEIGDELPLEKKELEFLEEYWEK